MAKNVTIEFSAGPPTHTHTHTNVTGFIFFTYSWLSHMGKVDLLA